MARFYNKAEGIKLRELQMNDNNSILSPDEFNGIFTEYYSDLCCYAYGFVEDMDCCRDIVADAFGHTWENRDKIKLSTVGSFLYSCVKNRCIDHLRHQQAARNYLDQILLIAEADEEIPPEEHRNRLQTMKRIIGELPPKTRFVLEQCYFHNKKYNEVAEILDITPSGVKKHIMKALAILRQNMRTDKEI